MRIVQGDNISTGMAVGAAVITAGVLGYLLLVPKPTIGQLWVKHQKQVSKLKTEIDQLQKQAVDLRAKPKEHLFTTSEAAAAPEALSRLNSIGSESHVVINGFRPQTKIDAGDLQILPYFLTLEGSFDSIATFLDKVEKGDPKLAVSMIQIAAPETVVAQTTASVTVVGYVKTATQDTAVADTSGKTAIKTTPDLGGHSGSAPSSQMPVTVANAKASDSVKNTNGSVAEVAHGVTKLDPKLKPATDKIIKDKQNG